MYIHAKQFNHKSLLNHCDIRAAREWTVAYMPHVAWLPRACFLPPCIYSCLFTAPQRLRTASGILRHRPTNPMPYRGWHLAAYVLVHPSFQAHICTYSQVVCLGLVSLQILFCEIASWLVCSTSSTCCFTLQPAIAHAIALSFAAEWTQKLICTPKFTQMHL